MASSVERRVWLIGGCACLASGLFGFALGAHHPPPPPAPPAPRAPIPMPPLELAHRDSSAEVDAGASADGGPPGLPTRISLTEPQPGDPLLEPLRPDAGRPSLTQRSVEPPRHVSAEAAPPSPTVKPTDAASAQELEAMAAQLKELQAQLAEQQQLQQQREQDSVDREANQHAAMTAIQSADSALAQGSTDIDDDLSQAEAALDGRAAGEIQSARDALKNDDLYSARQHLQRALLLGAQGNPNAVPPAPPP